jgi:hypothetical protein
MIFRLGDLLGGIHTGDETLSDGGFDLVQPGDFYDVNAAA